ncbi:LysM peptidoglycan-binding domain-containing protein [Flavobacterium franklandianum]|uniref:LysM peptidoglycan-binding domain-containing protein n=3 Tax=Flavobacterium TaxID=237 RepID=A0A553CQZ1_9FLAO|nr:LysM peptidoglycan-binding domain-containing protein [Flavobacterium franklandianum]
MMFMKYYSCLFLIVFFSSMSLFSQEKYKKHTVSKGETISEIAQKYNVKPSAIYELNPDAVNGINWKTVLLIPTNTKKNRSVSSPATASNLPEKTHEVLPKETLYGIAKQHHIIIEDLYKINPNLEKEGLKIGQTIKILQTALEDFAVAKETKKTSEDKKQTVSKKNNPKEEIVIAPKAEEKTEFPTQGIEYEILPKESLYSIAKKYGIKLADLQKANPELANKSIQVGQKLNVPVKVDTNLRLVAENKEMISKKEAAVAPQTIVVKKESEVAKTIPVLAQTTDDTKKSSTVITHEVLPKESLYSISKQYGISLSDLKKANPELGKKSLKVGQKISVLVKSDTNSSLVAENKEVKSPKEIAVVPQNIEDKKSETEISHEVLPKETKYGIAKQYGLKVAELEKQNPNISKKLLVGYLLKIRTSKLIQKEIAIENAIALEAENVTEKFENKESNIVRDATFVDQLISKASENIGTRYRSGGTTTDGFDCSGLICYTFSSYDIKLPRSSIEMASYGSKIDAENAQKGDLIFFKTNGRSRINHVGMVVEVLDGEIKFIHSATHGGVIISSTKESYYEKNLVQVNRVL